MKKEEKQKAKELLKTHNQKETAKIVGVNERTMGVWVKQFKNEEITERKERNILIEEIRILVNEIREFRKNFSKLINK